jgi:hypothetical protein
MQKYANWILDCQPFMGRNRLHGQSTLHGGATWPNEKAEFVANREHYLLTAYHAEPHYHTLVLAMTSTEWQSSGDRHLLRKFCDTICRLATRPIEPFKNWTTIRTALNAVVVSSFFKPYGILIALLPTSAHFQISILADKKHIRAKIFEDITLSKFP